MNSWLIWAGVALMILWVVVRFALAVTSVMIHVVLGLAVLLLIIGLIRSVMHRSSGP
jgi:hypothetical protein